MKILLITFCLFANFNLKAELEVYKDTDNAGLNKKERIDSIEKYLTELSKNIKNLEVRFEENAKKIKQFDESLSKMKSDMTKDQGNKVSENSEGPKNNSEVVKLRNEFENFRAKDFERLKNELNSLTESVNQALKK